MKKFLLVVLLLVLLVVGGGVALIMRSFNPTTYQNQVIASVQKLTGRELSVYGQTVVSWNPVPTIVMNDVRLANIEKGSKPDMLSIEKIKVEIDWKSILKSPLLIKKIELTNPHLTLERLESNKANFAFPFLLDADFQLQEMNNALEDTALTKIDSIQIKNGQIDYANQITQKSVQITEVNGSIAADSIRGPFVIKGNGMVENRQYDLDMKTNAFKLDEPIDMTVDVKEHTMGMSLVVEGKLTPASLDKWFEGAGQFSIEKPMVAFQNFKLPIPSETIANQPVSGSVSFEITSTTDTLKNFVVQFGNGENKTTVGGTILQTVVGSQVSYNVDIAMDTFRSEQWQNYVQKLDWQWLTGKDETKPIHFKAEVKEIPYQKGKITDIAISGKYENKALSVQTATAVLPGKTKLTLEGSGSVKKETPTMDFLGHFEAESMQELAQWLAPDKKDQWVALKEKAGVGAIRIAWTPERVGMSFKDLNVNDAVMTGIFRKNLNATPIYELKLTGKNINVDEYTGWKGNEKAVSLTDLIKSMKDNLEKNKELIGLSLKTDINLTDATVFGIPMANLMAIGEINDGALKITSLKTTDMASANMNVSGMMSGLGKGQMAVEGLNIGLDAKQLPLLLQKAKIETNVPLFQKATDTKIQATIKGGSDGAWSGKIQGSLSDATIKVEGALEAVDTNPTIKEGTFEINHPNFKTWMSLIAPKSNILPNLDGIFKMKGTIVGDKNKWQLKNTSFGVGLQQLSGDLTFDNQKIKTVVAKVASPSIDLERWLNDSAALYTPMSGFSKKKIDMASLNDWNIDVQLNAGQLMYKNVIVKQADVHVGSQNKELSLMKLSGMSGSADNSPLSITGKLDWNNVPTLSLDLDIQNLPLRSDFMVLRDIALGGGALTLNGELKARGATVAEMAQNLNGQGKMQIIGGQIIGADVEQMIPIITRAVQRNEVAKVFEPEFKRVLHSGKSVIQSVSGDFTVANGIMRMMDMTLKTNNTTANPTQVIWDPTKRTMEISIPVLLNPLNTLPPFVLGISVNGGQGVYKPNYTDLVAALSNQSQTAMVENMRQQEAKAQMEIAQKRSDRIKQSQELTKQARAAVEGMEKKIKEFPFEKGKRLLQSSRDALTIVNQLSVREEPTDAQLIQLIEQARLILVKAEEFQKSLEQESLFGAQTALKTYLGKGNEMVSEMAQAAAAYPDVAILVRLSDNANQNMAIIKKVANQISPKLSAAETDRIMKVCEEAYGKIEKAYQHIKRFDLSGGQGQSKTAVKGSFKRAQ